jgi:hypothetical protein
MSPSNTLILDLSHWIPLFSLIVVIPIIFNIFLPSHTLIWDLSHRIPLCTLIVVIPIIFNFILPTHTLILDLSHWIPLFSLIVVIPIIFNFFFYLVYLYRSRHPYFTLIPLVSSPYLDHRGIYNLFSFLFIDPPLIPSWIPPTKKKPNRN